MSGVQIPPPLPNPPMIAGCWDAAGARAVARATSGRADSRDGTLRALAAPAGPVVICGGDAAQRRRPFEARPARGACRRRASGSTPASRHHWPQGIPSERRKAMNHDPRTGAAPRAQSGGRSPHGQGPRHRAAGGEAVPRFRIVRARHQDWAAPVGAPRRPSRSRPRSGRESCGRTSDD